jgi:hypothetical protein
MALYNEGIVAIDGALSFTLGIGLENLKSFDGPSNIPYIKGSTGMKMNLNVNANATFPASIG